MKTMARTVLATLSAILALGHAPIHAQSAEALAGWIGLVTTPSGAFAPAAPVSRGTGLDIRARWGHWQFAEDDDNTTNLAVGVGIPAGSGRVTVEVGRTTRKDCDGCDALLFGVETDLPLRDPGGEGAGVGVHLQPALGYMNMTGDADGSALGASVRLPVALHLATGEGSRLVPFLSPGTGLGRIAEGDFSEQGFRFLLGGGLAWETGARFRLSGGFNRIFIEGGATVFGASVSVAP